MVEYILSFISLTNILELPAIIKYPGFLIMVLLAVRVVRSLLSLKPFAAIYSTITFFVVAFILSRFGQGIATMLEGSQAQQ